MNYRVGVSAIYKYCVFNRLPYLLYIIFKYIVSMTYSMFVFVYIFKMSQITLGNPTTQSLMVILNYYYLQHR